MENTPRPKHTAAAVPAKRQPWEPMRLTYMGHVAEIVQGGRGKLSKTGGDPGEARKQRAGRGEK